MATRTKKDRSGDITRIALLAALKRRPMHGYDVKTTLASWSMDWWADIQSGSIYTGLRKLESEGFAEVASTGRNGNRPERRTYRITDAGRRELVRLLRAAWQDASRFARPVDIALSFYDELDRSEVIELLQARLDDLIALAGFFDVAKIPPLASDAQTAVVTDLWEHEVQLTKTEIEWTRRLVRRLKGSAYPASYGTKREGKRGARTRS